ncbi:phage tail sheath C-terminal domain-containing protein [Agrobacterium tumefaciens]|uniref:phage tail sheath C-terminal domain-containing protein n=1 Tax=Agrobacterium tumefaciens TaxID=358 RepID=UPI002244DBCE|nr:phage tail sheath C-terminal domain-containing protein [Agrobacterium tumefaciens]MCW8059308.1 phage tail sheath subtilisin-like domain-containing protein [Agrobacterium tumefaciens]MCW8147118.1 phage tail sheath subtilisin-like domain-containing protein [Agrobacterium tumefaciens]
MADLAYAHGVTLTESTETPSLLRVQRQGITFINGTAPDADQAAFPLNTPTLITSLTQATGLGADGTLLEDVKTVFGEGGSWCIINRVEHSADPAELQANLIGDAVARTGLYAALRAKGITSYQPRVIVTAGNTGAWVEAGVVSVSVVAEGSKLTEPPIVKATGGGNDQGKELPTLEAVMGEGTNADKVVAVRVVKPGKKLSEPPVITFEGGGADAAKVLPEATANVGDVANPFVSALNAITPKIRARAYISGPNTTNAEALRFRRTINGGRILVIDPKVIKNVNGVPVTKPVAAVFAGVRSRVVASSDGVSGSVSNKIIRTIDGVARTIMYPDDSNYLNENQVATIINERGGFRTWGSRLATDDPLWQFDSVRATADMINEALEDIYFLYVDRKFTKANMKMMIEDGNAALRVFKNNEDILGGRCWFPVLNDPTLMANGKLFLDVEFEPVGIMEQIHITTHRNILYYRLLLDEVNGLIETGPLAVAA